MARFLCASAILLTIVMSRGNVLLATETERYAELPTCGLASAYAMLHLSHQDVTLVELRERFRRVEPGIDWNRISMRAIRQVLNDSGVPTQGVRFAPRELSTITAPAILYFRPGKWLVAPSSGNGHFVARSPDRATGMTGGLPFLHAG